jgi:ATP-binding cassette subfamily C protein/ATP-binding cassette subfamily C exporter for protease/lipase
LTTIVVSHRANLLRVADKILVMMDGRVSTFGDAADVIAELGGDKSSTQSRRIRNGADAPKPATPSIPAI